MSVLIDNRQELVLVDEKMEAFVEKVVNAAMDYEGCEEDYEISISLVGNEEIQSLNKAYRDIDMPTDVLSFPMLDFEDESEDEIEDDLEDLEDADVEIEYVEEELALGDIVISTEKVKEQAEEYGHSVERELAFLLVHGMLHLLGYDHENEADEKVMFDKQEAVLKQLGINR